MSKSERQSPEWGKVFANDITNNELISNLYKQLSIKKTQTIWFKNGQKDQIDIFQGENAEGQPAHEKMLNIVNYQGNANQNHSETLSHTC